MPSTDFDQSTAVNAVQADATSASAATASSSDTSKIGRNSSFTNMLRRRYVGQRRDISGGVRSLAPENYAPQGGRENVPAPTRPTTASGSIPSLMGALQ